MLACHLRWRVRLLQARLSEISESHHASSCHNSFCCPWTLGNNEASPVICGRCAIHLSATDQAEQPKRLICRLLNAAECKCSKDCDGYCPNARKDEGSHDPAL